MISRIARPSSLASRLSAVQSHGARAVRPAAMAFRDMTILSKKSAEEYAKENYNERMERTKRPVSPHVTIYSFPVVALSSITCRVTGTALSVGVGALCVSELFSTGSSVALLQEVGSSSYSYPAKFAVAFPLTYHYGAGIRHMFWDKTPDQLTNQSVEKSAYILGATSFGIGFLAMFV